MRVQVITNNYNFFSFRIILIQQFFDLVCPINCRPVLTNVDLTPACQRLGKHKILCCAITLVFIIHTLNFARFNCYHPSCFLDQLCRLLVHANNRNGWVIRLFVDFQDILHIRDKCSILFRGYYPAFPQVRFKFVFLSVLHTVCPEIQSTTFRAISSSANICIVHLAHPSGGLLQAIDINRASLSPSRTRLREGACCFLRSRAA